MGWFLDDAPAPYPARAIITDDPMRVKMLVAHHLDHARLVSEQRGMLSYIGEYNGTPVGVFSVGYGEASTLAFLREIVQNGAESFIYIGECVSFTTALGLHNIVLACSANGARGDFPADGALSRKAAKAAARLGITVSSLPVFTDDAYWIEEEVPAPFDINVVDFATNTFYRYARQHNIPALSILTVSALAPTGERIGEAERQSRFYGAALLAFESAV